MCLHIRTLDQLFQSFVKKILNKYTIALRFEKGEKEKVSNKEAKTKVVGVLEYTDTQMAKQVW